jgi:hypothetical protein
MMMLKYAFIAWSTATPQLADLLLQVNRGPPSSWSSSSVAVLITATIGGVFRGGLPLLLSNLIKTNTG